MSDVPEDFEMSDAFRAAWAKKEVAGYRYGRDALEGVRFGFEIAEEEFQAERRATAALVQAAKAWARFGRDDSDDEHELLKAIDACCAGDGEGK